MECAIKKSESIPFSFSSRDDWRASALRLVIPPARAIAADPARPLFWEGWPSIGDVGARRLQMFTRALQPAFALLAHEGEALVLPIGPDGAERGVAAWLRELLSHAFDVRTGPLLTFPDRPMDQRIVEAAALAELLVVNRSLLWDPLPGSTCDRLLDWFEFCLSCFTLSINNWNLFAVQIAVALDTFGRAYRRDGIRRLLGDVEEMYKGEGWYADGYYRQFDQYVPAEIFPQIGANVLYARTVIPTLEGRLEPGTHHWAAAAWQSSSCEMPDAVPSVVIHVERSALTLYWAAGNEETVELTPPDIRALRLDSGKGREYKQGHIP